MKLKLADLFPLIREAAVAFGQDKAPRLAAAIAYYALFSIAPLLLFAVAVAGFFLTDQTVINNLFGPGGIVRENLGEKGAAFLQDMIKSGSLNKGSVVATVVGFVTLFMGATGLFVQLQDALNSLWGAEPAPRQGVGQMVHTRIVSFLMVIGIGLILIAFLGLNTYLSVFAQHLGDTIGAGAFFVRLGTAALSVLLLTPVFALIYKFLPSVKLQWQEVWVGGAVTAMLFTLGQLAIGVYLGRTAPGSVFGAAASLVALMLWIYYSGMIFFFGAEVTWVYSQKFGTHAGGAVNAAKKEALAARGLGIDPTPSGQEVAAQAQAGPQDMGPDARRRLGLPRRRGAPTSAPGFQVRAYSPGETVPGVGAALWNALTAILAVPAVLALRLLGWKGTRYVRRK
ncbi:YihY/virulence factor BrkB family protein [Deinococcus hopiensis]|uniref:Membrane protein n=1 Tax=Deinococcus hopiensis KR-140 TaxID=695939 RepID=A0A1W1VRC4_9DEIO|nr:YihY/virulence factor BrkB family protein [Deinococcus hopiensis]SMB95474.1 membrane protein [Deinococcus hopiensis KR-140]